MSLTRIGVMERLTQIDAQLEAMLRESDVHPAEVYARAKRQWEYEYAATYLTQEGTVEQRKQATIVKLYRAGVYKNLVNAEAAYEGWSAAFRVLDKRASIGQSLLKAFDREGDTAGVQPAWSNRQEVAA